MTYSDFEIWGLIALLGIGTFLIRFSFIGLIGDRKLPDWVLAHLRYTPVAVLPGLVAPLVLWPAATGGQPDLARGVAAIVTLIVGLWFKNMLAAVFCGAASLYLVLYISG